MPKKYVLKTKLWTEDKINRLIKEIKINAEHDRKESTMLLDIVKGKISEFIDRDFETNENGIVTFNPIDTTYKLINSAAQALSHMGAANEKLLKLAQVLHKFKQDEAKLESSKAPPSKLNELRGSMFANLQAFVDEEEND